MSKHLFAGLVLAASAALIPGAVHAYDSKGVMTSSCQPFGTTLASDLAFLQNSIFNPGTVGQRVICPIPKDYQGGWTDAVPAYIVFYFRAGGVAGRVSCTTYVGSYASNGVVVTASDTPAPVAAGTLSSGTIQLRDSASSLAIFNTNAICTITPKAYFGGIWLREEGVTHN